MTDRLQQYPGRVLIEEVTHTTGDITANITDLVSEINIHSSMHIDSTFGEILLIDYSNYVVGSRMIAGDVISIRISHNDVSTTYDFKIKALTDIQNGESGRTYNVKLVSELQYNSYFRKVSKAYAGTTSDIAGVIFSENTSEQFNIWEPSLGVQSLIIPALSPIKSINWLAGRSKSITSQSKFVFFQDSKLRYNFLSIPKLRDLYGSAPVTYRYSPNTFGEDTGGAIIPNSSGEMTSIIRLDYLNSYDVEKAVDAGSLFITRIRVDHTQKEVDFQQNNYWDTFVENGVNTGSQWKYEDMSPGKVEIVSKARDTTPFGFNDAPGIMTMPYIDRSQEIEIQVFGNNLVDIGQIIRVEIPAAAPLDRVDSSGLDARWSGNYYVTAKRDKIDRRTHIMVLRCTKDSQITGDYE